MSRVSAAWLQEWNEMLNLHWMQGAGVGRIRTEFATRKHEPNIYEDTKDPTECTYWLSRVLMLRTLAFVLLCAFLSCAFQDRALIGHRGLEPIRPHQDAADAYSQTYKEAPTKWTCDGTTCNKAMQAIDWLWVVEGRPTPVYDIIGFGDAQLTLVAWTGVYLSLVFLFSTVNTMLVPFLLWVIYLSYVNLQSRFVTAHAWEWQLLETTFLAIFLCPFYSWSSYPSWTPPPRAVMYLFRLLGFRLVFGAGVSKLMNDLCWKQFLCTASPMPSPIGWFTNMLPSPFHYGWMLMTYVLELGLSWVILLPVDIIRNDGVRKLSIGVGALQVALQLGNILTGNFGFTHWLNLIPLLATLDDHFLLTWASATTSLKVVEAIHEASPLGSKTSEQAHKVLHKYVRYVMDGILSLFISYKSLQPLKDLMNISLGKIKPMQKFYDKNFFVNTYDIANLIQKTRYELVLWYTHRANNEYADAAHPLGLTTWHQLEFKCLPGALTSTPCMLSPYIPRLDWVTWDETMRSWYSGTEGRFVPAVIEQLAMRILGGERAAVSLLGSPLSEVFGPALNFPPIAIMAELYTYDYADGFDYYQRHNWWNRVRVKGPMIYQEAWKGPELVDVLPEHDCILFFAVLGVFFSVHGATELRRRDKDPVYPDSPPPMETCLPSPIRRGIVLMVNFLRLPSKLASGITYILDRLDACPRFNPTVAMCNILYFAVLFNAALGGAYWVVTMMCVMKGLFYIALIAGLELHRNLGKLSGTEILDALFSNAMFYYSYYCLLQA